jgi:phospholipid transport system transporter-binding protein
MLVLPQTVTVNEARDVLRMLEQTVRRDNEPALVIDASALHDFDTAALAVLLECARHAKAWGKDFLVRAAPAKLVELARLYGVDELLSMQREAAEVPAVGAAGPAAAVRADQPG